MLPWPNLKPYTLKAMVRGFMGVAFRNAAHNGHAQGTFAPDPYVYICAVPHLYFEIPLTIPDIVDCSLNLRHVAW